MVQWRAVVREPLVHFAVLGAALFAVDHWRAPRPSAEVAASPAQAPAHSPAADPAARRIVVNAAVLDDLRRNLALRDGRPASASELAEATEQWIDREVLSREAIARGLDRNDPILQQRTADTMAFVLGQQVRVPEPSEAELRAYFDAHRERWATPERLDFTHVFVAGHDAAAGVRAAELLAELEQGTSPDTLGDRFTGGRRYRGRKPADLATTFGPQFVAGLDRQAAGAWIQRPSRYGLHLVRLDRRDTGSDAHFELARLDVRSQLIEQRRRDGLRAAVAELRRGWQVVRP